MSDVFTDEGPWRSFLRTVLQHPSLHARWLNTLSMMEHIGCRKIVKALDSNALDEALLRHIAEEARHAHFFKKLCLRVMPGVCTTYSADQLFCGVASRHYFQSLDRAVSDYLEHASGAHNPALVYLCVTTLIEIRAARIYKLYEDELRASDLPFSLRSVITEEGRHLDEMRDAFARMDFSWSTHADALHAIESRLFDAWSVELRDALDAAIVRERSSDQSAITPLDTM